MHKGSLQEILNILSSLVVKCDSFKKFKKVAFKDSGDQYRSVRNIFPSPVNSQIDIFGGQLYIIMRRDFSRRLIFLWIGSFGFYSMSNAESFKFRQKVYFQYQTCSVFTFMGDFFFEIRWWTERKDQRRSAN